jgi:hypothetical protein
MYGTFKKNAEKLIMKIARPGSASGSGSISQRHGSADPDPRILNHTKMSWNRNNYVIFFKSPGHLAATRVSPPSAAAGSSDEVGVVEEEVVEPRLGPPGLRIRIDLMRIRIRIQHFFYLRIRIRIQGLMT